MEIRSPKQVPIIKIVAYEYFLICMLENFGLDTKLISKENIEKYFNNIGVVYINRIFYFMLLESNIKYGDTLMKIFDTLTAYPLGIVDYDIYENRKTGIFFLFDVDESGKLTLTKQTDIKRRINFIIKDYSFGKYINIRDIIKECTKFVLDKFYEVINVEDLIAKTRLLPFYRKCYYKMRDNDEMVFPGDISNLWLHANKKEKDMEINVYKEQSYQM